MAELSGRFRRPAQSTETVNIRLYCNNGEIIVDPTTGKIISRIIYGPDPEFDAIVKIDLQEYGYWYSRVPSVLYFSDVGVWFADGRYKPPDKDYRVRDKIVYGDETY